MKKLAIIGSVGLPANYGGFETLVEYLVEPLQNQFDITVYCSAKRYKTQLTEYKGVKLHYINFDANGKESLLYDMKSLKHAKGYADIILLLGVSGAFYLPFINRKKIKVITNIDGLEWRRNKWSGFQKQLLKKLEAFAVRYSSKVVCDNQAIVDYVKEEYQKESFLIEYGGDQAIPQKFTQNDSKKYPFLRNSYYFMVARIEPENNIKMILDAFSKTDKTMVLVGNWDNSDFARNLKLQYNHYNNLQLIGPIYDQKELNKLRSNCTFYIHGHSAGGTNPSLVEAMHLGLDIIAFDVSFNRFTTEEAALYFQNEASLIDLITQTNPSKKRKQALLKIAKNRYTWNAISKKYEELMAEENSQ